MTKKFEFIAPCLDVERMIIDPSDLSDFPALPAMLDSTTPKNDVKNEKEISFLEYASSMHGIVVLSLSISNILLFSALIFTLMIKRSRRNQTSPEIPELPVLPPQRELPPTPPDSQENIYENIYENVNEERGT